MLTDAYFGLQVLWRQKEQFSDGVGYSWIDTLKQEAERIVSDLQMKFAASRFPHSTPRTKVIYQLQLGGTKWAYFSGSFLNSDVVLNFVLDLDPRFFLHFRSHDMIQVEQKNKIIKVKKFDGFSFNAVSY